MHGGPPGRRGGGVPKQLHRREWQTILFTPLWAFTAVAGADRKIDDKELGSREGARRGDALPRRVRPRSALGRRVGARDGDAGLRRRPTDDRRGLQDAATILDAKPPAGAADGCKQATILIALNVAKASGSSFGDKTSKEEKAAIGLVAAALRVPIPVG